MPTRVKRKRPKGTLVPSSRNSELLKQVVLELSKVPQTFTPVNRVAQTGEGASNHTSVRNVNASPDLALVNKKGINHDCTPIDMMALNLKGLTMEEKKRVLRESIAKLEAEEDNQELQELMAKHEALRKKRASTTSTPTGKVKVKGNKNDKCKSKNVKGTRGNGSTGKVSYAQIDDTDFDADTFVKSSMPDISDIKDLLQIPELKLKREKLPKKKNKARRKHSYSNSSSASETKTSSELETDKEVESPPVKRAKKGRKKVSGYYARVGSSRIVSNELFAHAALEE